MSDTDVDKTVIIEGYKVLLQHIQYEGNLMWAKTAGFLTFSAAWLGLLLSHMTGSGSLPRLWLVSGALLGALGAIAWVASSMRSIPYYKLWWQKLNELEEKLQPLSVFQTGRNLFNRDVIKESPSLIKHFWIYRWTNVGNIHRVLALVFLAVWIALLIYLLLCGAGRAFPMRPV